MKRALLLSFLLHFSLLSLFQVKLSPSKKRYPYRIYRVSLVPAPLRVPGGAEEAMEEEKPTEITPLPKKRKAEKRIKAKKRETKTEKIEKKEKVIRSEIGLGARVSSEAGGSFEYSYYLAMILKKIGKNWRNPYQFSPITIRAVIFFTINRDGRIADVRIEEPSGNIPYDQAALRAVLVTKRLPPLPQEFKGNYLRVHLEFEHKK